MREREGEREGHARRCSLINLWGYVLGVSIFGCSDLGLVSWVSLCIRKQKSFIKPNKNILYYEIESQDKTINFTVLEIFNT